MEFNLSESQEMLRKSAEEFLQKECPRSLVRQCEQTAEGYSPELWRKMAGLGWMGLVFPAQYGGSDCNFLDLAFVLEEMGKALVPGPFIPTVCCGLAILHNGTEAQKRELLPGVVSGERMLAPAFTRPRTPADGKLREKVRQHNEYVLTGTRLFVPYAHVADWLLFPARDAGSEILFVVDSKSPRINLTHLPTIALDKQYEVAFDKVSVPQARALPGRARQIVGQLDKWAALAYSAYILGALEQVLNMSVEYAKQRIQFEKPIGSFQAIQHQCADMLMDVDGVKFLTYKAAWLLSKGATATREISMAKARASDAARRVSLLGVKIHGGTGITMHNDTQLYFRRAKVAELAFGDGDFHRQVVAKELGL